MPAVAPSGLAELVARLHPSSRIVEAVPLAPDRAEAAPTAKAGGYGIPWRLTLQDARGETRRLVFHTVTPDRFGHDRRADRAEELLLAFDTFATIPRHVAALDVGAVTRDGRLVSLRETGEFWLLTEWAEGAVYAGDLRRIAEAGSATLLDEQRVRALASRLAHLHRRPLPECDREASYVRAIRDLVGHGEGIFGMVDGYPPDTPGAPASRLHAIERGAAAYRQRLRSRAARLAVTHGDFHPFNVVFGEGTEFTLLDASRGGRGDPADDVVCMAINYPFFALGRSRSWPALRALLHQFVSEYLERSGDAELAEVAPPYLAWRALVLASPRFYPSLPPVDRGRLLLCAERVLDEGRLEWDAFETLFP